MIKKRKTKVKERTYQTVADHQAEIDAKYSGQGGVLETQNAKENDLDEGYSDESKAFYDAMFDNWDEAEFESQDFMVDVPVDSLEAFVGYSSLFRQMHQAFVRQVAFYRSDVGGKLSSEEARKAAFHSCANKEEAKKRFRTLMRLPIECLNFVDLQELQTAAPRVAEWLWERAKREGAREFFTGHLGANIAFPVGYMKQVWNIARYLGVRDSFIDEWNPKGGIEIALIDMMTQSYFQWQYWIEQTVKRSETREKEHHPEYHQWLAQRNRELKSYGITDGYWNRPFVSEQQALEHAVQMADRFNRIFMRTLRQLRDLRRYAPVTINNPNQVNIAADGGQQVNVSKTEGGNESNEKKITT